MKYFQFISLFIEHLQIFSLSTKAIFFSFADKAVLIGPWACVKKMIKSYKFVYRFKLSTDVVMSPKTGENSMLLTHSLGLLYFTTHAKLCYLFCSSSLLNYLRYQMQISYWVKDTLFPVLLMNCWLSVNWIGV